MRAFQLLAAIAGLGGVLATPSCPKYFTMTSKDCTKYCTDSTFKTYNGCNVYPAQAEFQCSNTSTGYCVPLADTGCQLKCFSAGFLQEDPQGTRSLELGMRGTWGSFGRAEPVQIISGLAFTNVSKLSLKDYNVNEGQEPLRRVALRNSGVSKSELTTLELVNVFIDFGKGHVLPKGLKHLMLFNNRLVHTSKHAKTEVTNTTSLFPEQIFSQTSLEYLDISGNPSLTAAGFSDKELAFFRKIKVFVADFKL